MKLPEPNPSDTPKTYYRKLLQTLVLKDHDKANDFSDMVQSSINLEAKNTSNFKSRDLAILQLSKIAEHYID